MLMDAQNEATALQCEYVYTHGGHGNGSVSPVIQPLRQPDGTYKYRYDSCCNIIEEPWEGPAQSGNLSK